MMKVLILGAGAMGGYYGARMIEAGAAVTFLVREGRFHRLAERGLRVRSELAPFHRKIVTTLVLAPNESFDLVLLACKGYDLESAMEAITPAVQSGAFVLPLLNGLAVYDRLDDRFGTDKVLGGVFYIASTLDSSGEIVHMGTFDKLIVGARSPAQAGTACAIHALLSHGVGMRTLSTTIEQDLWDKWVLLAAGAAVTCLMRATVGDIMAADAGRDVMTRAIQECAAVAADSDHRLSEETLRSIETRLLDRSSTWAASMMRDIVLGASQLEAFDIVGDMLRRAELFGHDAGTLRIAYCHLQVYEALAKQRTRAA